MTSRALKRTGDDAELPLADRARRAMMALVADLGEVVSLFDAVAAGRTGPLPLATTLSATAFELLGRASAVMRPDLVASIEQHWLPDDMLRYIFEFVLGRRQMSRFEADGRATNPPVKLVETKTARAVPVRPLRLVCRKWSSIASQCVMAIRPSARARFDAAHYARLFPNVVFVDQTKKYQPGPLAEAEKLIKLYAERQNKPVYVLMSRDTPIRNAGGAYCNTQYKWNDHVDAVPGAKVPFNVWFDPMTLQPSGTICCCSDNLGAALTSRMPLSIKECIHGHPITLDAAVFFDVPTLKLVPELFLYPDMMKTLATPSNWANGQYPTFELTDVICRTNRGDVGIRNKLYSFCNDVGIDHIYIHAYGKVYPVAKLLD